MSEENGSHSVEFMSNMWVASAAHEWMVVTLEQAKDSVKKVPTRAPAQETTAYLGDLGPYSC